MARFACHDAEQTTQERKDRVLTAALQRDGSRIRAIGEWSQGDAIPYGLGIDTATWF